MFELLINLLPVLALPLSQITNVGWKKISISKYWTRLKILGRLFKHVTGKEELLRTGWRKILSSQSDKILNFKARKWSATYQNIPLKICNQFQMKLYKIFYHLILVNWDEGIIYGSNRSFKVKNLQKFWKIFEVNWAVTVLDDPLNYIAQCFWKA